MPREQKTSKAVLRNRSVFAALFAAIIAVSCFVRLSFGPFAVIPVVLQNMMALLAGALLGPAHGSAAVLLFLIAGIIGLPVFSGGSGGLAVVMGPTGGFLAGYLAGAFLTGLLLGVPKLRQRGGAAALARTACAGLAGFLMIYIPGLLWYAKSWVMPRDGIDFAPALQKALGEAFVPFVPGDLAKLVLFTLLAWILRPSAAAYIGSDDGN